MKLQMKSPSSLLDERQKGGIGSSNDGFYESKRRMVGRATICFGI